MKSIATSSRVRWICLFTLALWTIWQLVDVEIIRRPWEDEVLYDLPAVNWALDGHLSLPQMGGFMDADRGWRWHMPFYPALGALWFKVKGCELETIRQFGLLPASLMAYLLAWACVRLARQETWPWMFFWLAIILGDKSIVMNSVAGRMEFWSLLGIIAALALALKPMRPITTVFAGLLLGLAMGFHPFAVYFLPGLLWLTLAESKSRMRSAMLFLAGAGAVVLPIAGWFLSDWPLTRTQFFAQVHGTIQGGNVLHNVATQYSGLVYNFRFQPFLLLLIAAGIVVHAVRLGRNPAGAPAKTISIGLLLLVAGAIAFLLQDATVHLNYYTLLVVTALPLLAAALPILRSASAGASRTAIVILALLLANNLAFVAAKSRTIWINRCVSDPAPMNAFLDDELGRTNRCVLADDLWLYGAQRRLDFRVATFPVLGQSTDTYRAYRQSLLDWRPDVIILDRGENGLYPDRAFTPEELATAGYVEQKHFDRVFRDRFLYDGYRLVVYRRAP